MRSIIREGRDWAVAPLPDESLVAAIRSSLGCGRPFAVLLAQRGGTEWEQLIDPGLAHLHSPFLMHDMDVAVDRILQAASAKERIFVHGDFDVDGLSGAAVLYLGLRPLFPANSIKVEVGDRTHGHGLSRPFVLRAIEEAFDLVLTVDCGISNADEIKALGDAGIDTIVTDHHVPPPDLPNAVAIVDPHRTDCAYPNQNLAGVGVAFKLICGVYERLGRPFPAHLLDLTALGTIADLVPLAGDGDSENRALVKEAFARIGEDAGSSMGLRALMAKLSVNPKKISATDIGFFLAPKLNAANRAGDPKVAFLLLITEQQDQAEYLAEILLDYNRDREIAQNDLIAQAEQMIREENLDPQSDGLLFLTGKYWNEGILGLVASNLADRYRVPAMILSRNDRISRASCRSVGGFDMNACLRHHADLLLQYGGHKMAAGFSVSNDLLGELEEKVLAYAATHRDSIPQAEPDRIDAEIRLDEVDLRFYTNLNSLAPFGNGNPAPRFLVRGCSFQALTLVGNRRHHLKGRAVQEGTAVPLIAFRLGKHLSRFEESQDAALVCHVNFDDWRSNVQVQGIDLVQAEAQ